MLQLQEVVVCILFVNKVREVCEVHLFYAPDGLRSFFLREERGME